jgi:hypothetical protein
MDDHEMTPIKLELQKKCIQQMSKEPKYSTGAHSGNKILQ